MLTSAGITGRVLLFQEVDNASPDPSYAAYGSAAFAFIAAGFWLMSATVKTPSNFSIRVIVPIGGLGIGRSTELDDLAKALFVQSWWNKYAAVAAAIAAVLQAVATVATA